MSQLGTLLDGRYQLIRSLGSGGFGHTFVAEDRGSGSVQCVVKQLKPTSQDVTFLEVARRLFFNEVEMLRKLGSHDRIPALLNDFEENDQFYLVQEYIEGRALSDELALVQKLDEPQVLSLLQDVLEVLEFVHQNHVIHRDIKPSNLIRRKADGRLVLIDFGAVKEIHTQWQQELSQLGPSKLTVGIATQGYGPSEQLAGRPRYNSDVYALGMTAIQALTGLHPSQLPTHPITGEVVWHDRADVSPWLAAILDKMVAYHFNQRFQSATEVREALDQTAIVAPTDVQGQSPRLEETLFPVSDIQLPITGGKEPLPAPAPVAKGRFSLLSWATVVGTVGFLATGLVLTVRQLGWLQPLELATYDQMVRLTPDPGPDPRLLVVGITEADIQEQKRFPIADQTLAQVIQQLQTYRPRAIGLDIFRDLPQEPGRSQLLEAVKAPNFVVITNLGTPIVPPPPGVPAERVGFNDVILDPDTVVRRNLMFADLKGQSYTSFALRLALMYLQADGIRLKPSPSDPTIPQLGQVTFPPLHPNFGGYQGVDDRGYQIMLRYRGRNVARQVSVGDVLRGKLTPEQVRDKVVLIGTTAANAKDLFQTPFSPTEPETPRTAGVLIHAQMLSQFLSAALDGRSPIQVWPDWAEILWVAVWSLAGGSLVWWVRRPWLLVLGETILLLGLGAMSVGLFLQGIWVPVVAPAIALGLATGILLLVPPGRSGKPEAAPGHRG